MKTKFLMNLGVTELKQLLLNVSFNFLKRNIVCHLGNIQAKLICNFLKLNIVCLLGNIPAKLMQYMQQLSIHTASFAGQSLF